MRFKAHINFLIEYYNINIFNIWIFKLHKIIRTHDVIFDENNFDKLSQINLTQMINESFLISDDKLNIFKLEFIRIEKLSDISNEKNLVLIFIDIIKIKKNDEKKLFIKALETDKNEIDKDDQRQEYLSLSTSFLLILSFSSTSSSLKNDQKECSIKNIENKLFLNIANILFEDFSRARKSTRKTIYCLTLNRAFIESK